MENQKTTQAVISDRPVPVDHKKIEKFALFTSDGTPLADVLADIEARLVVLETP